MAKTPDRGTKMKEGYRILVEHATVGMIVVQNGTIRFVNSRTLQMTGHDREELLSKPFAKLIHPGDREALKRSSLAEGQSRQDRTELPVRIVGKNETPLWVKTHEKRVSWKGRPATLYVLTDVTENKRLEEQQRILQMRLRRSQKLETLGRLAGGVVHNFNNLLSIIKSLSEACLEDAGEEGPLRKNLFMIRSTTERGSKLAKQLLSFSRDQLADTRVIDLNQLLRGMEIMLRAVAGRGVEVIIRPMAKWGRIKADPHQIEQVLINLAVNAKDAMPSGGRLTIETSNVILDQTHARRGQWILLSVSDTGIGIAPELGEKIFEPFFTTKEKGSGLGLSIVDGIVKESGGLIECESEPGKGTAFRVYLPCMDAEE